MRSYDVVRGVVSALLLTAGGWCLVHVFGLAPLWPAVLLLISAELVAIGGTWG